MGHYEQTTGSLKERIENIDTLPAIPEIAQKILSLRDDANCGIRDLTKVIELDPSIAAQIVRYASSPFFGCKEAASSIQLAISILGFDKTMNLALGLSTGKAFNVPVDGPIGLHAYWKNAIYCAFFMQKLSYTIDPKHNINTNLAYLCGLLHNIGVLLLGHIFPAEFSAVNQAIKNSPTTSPLKIEQAILGTQHTEIGVWLMRKWKMPAEIITTVYEHHNECYKGIHSPYANLALIANRALFDYQLSVELSSDLPPSILILFDIDETVIKTTLSTLMESRTNLNDIAKCFYKEAS